MKFHNLLEEILSSKVKIAIMISLLPLYGNVISDLTYSKEEWELKKDSKIIKQVQLEGEIILKRL
jgi:hypothetical protein